MSNRLRKNVIKGLRDESGGWQESPEGIETTVLDYLSNIFKLQCVLPSALHSVLEGTIPLVSNVANEALLVQVTAKEVNYVVFQMHHLKSPELDGMPPLFYQKFWHMVGEDVVKIVQSFFNSGRLSKEVCFTHVVLIPKVKDLEDMA